LGRSLDDAILITGELFPLVCARADRFMKSDVTVLGSGVSARRGIIPPL
jgi:hypothetical protein